MPRSSIQVLSFNILGSHSGPPHEWARRCPLVASLVTRSAPDIVGLQEARAHQITDLLALLPAYDAFGLSRSHPADDGDEQCAILVHRERFDVVQSGHFWLSQTPEIPASRSWETSLPRMVTHVRLHEKESGAETMVFNTHFDHKSAMAREQSALLLRARLEDLARNEPRLPIILTGDFNEAAPLSESEPGDAAYRVLTSPRASWPGLHDAHLSAPQNSVTGGTFHGFGPQISARIDWILCCSGLQIESAKVLSDEPESRHASDHFGVTARFSRHRVP